MIKAEKAAVFIALMLCLTTLVASIINIWPVLFLISLMMGAGLSWAFVIDSRY